MPDADHWNKLNEDCEHRATCAAGYCQESWGYGGPEAQWRMRHFADWLEELYVDVKDLIVCMFPSPYRGSDAEGREADFGLDQQEANCLYEDTFHACMVACAELVTMDSVDSDRHMKYIVRLRYAMHPDGYWTDWPYDVSDLLESDAGSESGAMFPMDDM